MPTYPVSRKLLDVTANIDANRLDRKDKKKYIYPLLRTDAMKKPSRQVHMTLRMSAYPVSRKQPSVAAKHLYPYSLKR